MIKVLCVDHNLNRIIELKDLLSDDYNVELAFTGWEGLGAAMLYNPDIMLLNLNVSVMDGLEVLRLLRTEEKLTELPVLGFTDPRNEEVENLALDMSCKDLFLYPFDKAALTQLIKKTVPPPQKDDKKKLPKSSS